MSRRLQIEWQETAEDLKRLYRQEKHPQRRERLMSFWHLCEGKQVKEVAEMTGHGCGYHSKVVSLVSDRWTG